MFEYESNFTPDEPKPKKKKYPRAKDCQDPNSLPKEAQRKFQELLKLRDSRPNEFEASLNIWATTATKNKFCGCQAIRVIICHTQMRDCLSVEVVEADGNKVIHTTHEITEADGFCDKPRGSGRVVCTTAVKDRGMLGQLINATGICLESEHIALMAKLKEEGACSASAATPELAQSLKDVLSGGEEDDDILKKLRGRQ